MGNSISKCILPLIYCKLVSIKLFGTIKKHQLFMKITNQHFRLQMLPNGLNKVNQNKKYQISTYIPCNTYTVGSIHIPRRLVEAHNNLVNLGGSLRWYAVTSKELEKPSLVNNRNSLLETTTTNKPKLKDNKSTWQISNHQDLFSYKV